MKKSFFARWFTLFLSVLLLVQPCVLATVRLQDDFYEAVNARWLDETSLSDSLPAVSGFQELSQAVTTQLLADFNAMCPDETPGALGQFLAYWELAKDLDTRNAQGAEPLLEKC